MLWLKRHQSYKRPSGKVLPRRINEVGGLFKRRQHFWQRRSFKIYTILAVLGLLFLFYLLFWSNIFKISNIVVTGANEANTAQISSIVNKQLQERRFLLFSQSNLWFFSSKMTQNEVEKAIILESVAIKKRPLKTLKIEVKEKTNQITLESKGKYYYLDPNGLVVKELLVANLTLVEGESAANAPGEALLDMSAIDPNIPLVHDLTENKIEVGKAYLKPQLIKFVIDLSAQLTQNNLKVKGFELPDISGKEVRAVLEAGYRVYFNAQTDLGQQLANLKLVIREKVKDRKIQYIDLRLIDKIYIK